MSKRRKHKHHTRTLLDFFKKRKKPIKSRKRVNLRSLFITDKKYLKLKNVGNYYTNIPKKLRIRAKAIIKKVMKKLFNAYVLVSVSFVRVEHSTVNDKTYICEIKGRLKVIKPGKLEIRKALKDKLRLLSEREYLEKHSFKNKVFDYHLSYYFNQNDIIFRLETKTKDILEYEDGSPIYLLLYAYIWYWKKRKYINYDLRGTKAIGIRYDNTIRYIPRGHFKVAKKIPIK